MLKFDTKKSYYASANLYSERFLHRHSSLCFEANKIFHCLAGKSNTGPASLTLFNKHCVVNIFNLKAVINYSINYPALEKTK